MRHVVSIALSLLVPLGATAQPENHIGQPLAAIFVANGCALTEQAALNALTSQGWHSSDFQAQVLALHRGGYVVKNAAGQLQLVNWGTEC